MDERLRDPAVIEVKNEESLARQVSKKLSLIKQQSSASEQSMDFNIVGN